MINYTLIKKLIDDNHPTISSLTNKGYIVDKYIILPNFAIFCKNENDMKYISNIIQSLQKRQNVCHLLPRAIIDIISITNNDRHMPMAFMRIGMNGDVYITYYDDPTTCSITERTSCPIENNTPISLIDLISSIFDMATGNDDSTKTTEKNTPNETSSKTASSDNECSNRCCTCENCHENNDEFYDDGKPISIEKVIYNDNATIILFDDMTKSVAVCDNEDTFSPTAGFAVALCKKILGNATFRDLLEAYVYEEEKIRKAAAKNKKPEKNTDTKTKATSPAKRKPAERITNKNKISKTD